MIALDTNLLVYAHRADMEQHAAAAPLVRRVAGGAQPWALPWPCLHEFYSTVTHVGRWKRPTPPADAMLFLRKLLSSQGVRPVGEGINHFGWLEKLVSRGNVHGGRIHDARIAAICLAHGVNELWSADRDFSLFPELKTRNPLK